METLFLGIGMAAIAIGCASWGIFDRWIGYKEKLAERDNDANKKIVLLSQENDRLNAHVTEMHDRLAMLEQSAIQSESSSVKLSNKIESLRN